ncbi:MAG: DUF1800 family protein, partial [Burkholderiales bacterium]|nr:DUF1800 family protein [Burkholderiales bacterium]
AWTFEEVAFYIPLPSNGNCGGNWPVYRSYSSDQIADANHRFTVDLTAHVRMPKRRGDVLEGIVMCAPVTEEEREADVVRFLEQATLGPSEALIAEVKAKGIEQWLDEQIPMNVTRYEARPAYDPPNGRCDDDLTPPPTPEKYCFSNNGSTGPVAFQFFRQSRDAPDQVRVRMAHVWHQIFVATQFCTYCVFEFQQRFRDHAFGSFENLLSKYALSPVLGLFQGWVKNVPEKDGVKPNENFARELMQLFTIGVNELNDDGTPKTDAAGQSIPAYTQADVEAMARVLTGFSYPQRPGQPQSFFNSWYFLGDMIPYDEHHDRAEKAFFGNRVRFPAASGAMTDFRAALAMLVNHANTPAFISRQLIQKTVTSSPSPGYVGRVAAAFRNNGKGVRGDLAAVTRAILLDPEARGAVKIDPEYGRMREPVLLWTTMIRTLGVTTDGLVPGGFVGPLGQPLFSPATVFNYYPADFTLLGSNIPAPEFGIFSSSSFIERANQVNNLFYGPATQSYFQPQPWLPNPLGTSAPDFTSFLPAAGDATALVDRFDVLMMHRAMSPAMRKTIVTAVDRLPASEARLRVELAAYLVLTSMEYQVQR